VWVCVWTAVQWISCYSAVNRSVYCLFGVGELHRSVGNYSHNNWSVMPVSRPSYRTVPRISVESVTAEQHNQLAQLYIYCRIVVNCCQPICCIFADLQCVYCSMQCLSRNSWLLLPCCIVNLYWLRVPHRLVRMLMSCIFTRYTNCVFTETCAWTFWLFIILCQFRWSPAVDPWLIGWL